MMTDSYLYHHGILGMHWGVRRTAEELANDPNHAKIAQRVYFRTAKMSPTEYANACKLWRESVELNLPQSEKEHVYEEFDNNLSAEEKESAIVRRPIGNYIYRAVNKGHNQYKIINKERINKSKKSSMIDEIMKEVIGDDWEEYDTD